MGARTTRAKQEERDLFAQAKEGIPWSAYVLCKRIGFSSITEMVTCICGEGVTPSPRVFDALADAHALYAEGVEEDAVEERASLH